VWLAGDHVLAEYPATLEAAVRSGCNAARAILREGSRTALRLLYLLPD
jgi:monoamine oxidase